MLPGFSRARSARDVADAGSQRGENGVQPLNHFCLAPDHHAVATLQAPDAAAGAHIHVVDPFGGKVLCAADVVHIIGIASIN